MEFMYSFEAVWEAEERTTHEGALYTYLKDGDNLERSHFTITRHTSMPKLANCLVCTVSYGKPVGRVGFAGVENVKQYL